MSGLLNAIMQKIGSSAVFWPAPNSGIYIARFRKELNDVAREFANYGYPSVVARYRSNGKKYWVEFCGKKGVVVARVRVHGEMGRPDEVLVACNIPYIKAVFAGFFPDLSITFSLLTA